jgi:magnesium-transporting ATPase (P-type)
LSLIGIGLSWWSGANGLALILALITGLIAVLTSWREHRPGALFYNADKLLPAKVTVRRNSSEHVIDREQLVIGDIVILRAGEHVPADLRLLDTADLVVDAQTLLGSHNQTTYSHATATGLPLQRRHNIALAGCQVRSGSGSGIVTATGAQTELGRLLSLAGASRGDSSRLQTLLGQQRSYVWLAAVASLAAILTALWRLQLAQPLTLSILTACCVAIVPAVLVIVASILFSTTSHQLRRKQLRLQALGAADRLGSIDSMLLDETFVLEPHVVASQVLVGRQVFSSVGKGFAPEGHVLNAHGKPLSAKLRSELDLLFEAAILTNEAQLLPPDAEHNDWHSNAHADQAALVVLAARAGYSAPNVRATYQREARLIHDYERQRGSVLVQHKHRKLLLVEGAATTMLSDSTRLWDGGHTRKLSVADKTRIEEFIAEQTALGCHCVALAYRQIAKATTVITADDEQDLTLLGIIALQRPLRPSIASTVGSMQRRGVTVSLLSAQPANVSRALIRQLFDDQTEPAIITSTAITQLADTQLLELLATPGTVWHELSPEAIARLIAIARQAKYRPAMTAVSLGQLPAARHAWVSLVPTSAQPIIANEADFLIKASNVSALLSAQSISRRLSDQLHQVSRIIFTNQATQLLVVLLGLILLGSHIPVMLSTSSLLLLSLVLVSLPLIAMRHDTPAQIGHPQHAPRGLGIFLAAVAAGLVSINYLFFFHRTGLAAGYIDPASHLHQHAATVALASLAICQWINVLFVRANQAAAMKNPALWRNSRLLWTLAVSLLLLAAVIYLAPLQRLLLTEPLSLADWLSICLVGAIYGLVWSTVRHERKHSRQALIALHHEVHGRGSGARV